MHPLLVANLQAKQAAVHKALQLPPRYTMDVRGILSAAVGYAVIVPQVALKESEWTMVNPDDLLETVRPTKDPLSALAGESVFHDIAVPSQWAETRGAPALINERLALRDELLRTGAAIICDNAAQNLHRYGTVLSSTVAQKLAHLRRAMALYCEEKLPTESLLLAAKRQAEMGGFGWIPREIPTNWLESKIIVHQATPAGQYIALTEKKFQSVRDYETEFEQTSGAGKDYVIPLTERSPQHSRQFRAQA